MKSWTQRKPIPKEIEDELSAYPGLLRELLYARGIKDSDAAEIFLNPSYERDLHDPFSILNMEKAVERILTAIKSDEKIIIYADYDADGIPGSVVLHDFFKKVDFENFEVYIPHRYKEGYGLNENAIREFAGNGVALIITIDCGITNVAEVKLANKLGIDVIVTDHHLSGEVLPDAYTIINPNQEGDTYENSNLCGGGVAFKLVQGLLQKGEFTDIPLGWEKWLLDVAGISTIADMVPLVGENRALAHFGLRVLQKTNRAGLLKLFQKQRVSVPYISEDDVGFVIAPHINAASRMSEPEIAFKMLSTSDSVQAHDVVTHLIKKNNERKHIVEELVADIHKNLSEKDSLSDVIVLGDKKWQPGLLGLAANRIMDLYQRPVCLWGMGDGDVLRGSCRSDGTVNIAELLEDIGDEFFIDNGGHKFSGGFAIRDIDLEKLSDVFLASYKKLKNTDVNTEIVIDKELALTDVNWDLFRLLSQLAPFGSGNDKPVFSFSRAKVLQSSFFGKKKNHLKILFDKGNGKKVCAIKFFVHSGEIDESLLAPESLIDIVANVEKEVFAGIPSIRLRLIDLKKSEV